MQVAVRRPPKKTYIETLRDDLDYFRERKDFRKDETFRIEEIVSRRDSYIRELQNRLHDVERKLQGKQERSNKDLTRLQRRYEDSLAANDRLGNDLARLRKEQQANLQEHKLELQEANREIARLEAKVQEQERSLHEAETEAKSLKHIRGLVDVCRDADAVENEEEPGNDAYEAADWETRQAAFNAASTYVANFPPLGADRLPATGAERIGGLSKRGAVAISRQAQKKYNLGR